MRRFARRQRFGMQAVRTLPTFLLVYWGVVFSVTASRTPDGGFTPGVSGPSW